MAGASSPIFRIPSWKGSLLQSTINAGLQWAGLSLQMREERRGLAILSPITGLRGEDTQGGFLGSEQYRRHITQRNLGQEQSIPGIPETLWALMRARGQAQVQVRE